MSGSHEDDRRVDRSFALLAAVLALLALVVLMALVVWGGDYWCPDRDCVILVVADTLAKFVRLDVLVVMVITIPALLWWGSRRNRRALARKVLSLYFEIHVLFRKGPFLPVDDEDREVRTFGAVSVLLGIALIGVIAALCNWAFSLGYQLPVW